MPVTSPARTVVDLASTYHRSRLAHLLDDVNFSRLATYCDVGEALIRAGSHRRQSGQILINLLDERGEQTALSQSRLELLLGDLLQRGGVTDYQRQVALPSVGRVNGLCDVIIEKAKVIIEADGRQWHSRQSDVRRDRELDFEAARHGYLTVRFLSEHLQGDLADCTQGLEEIISSRCSNAA